MTSLSPPKFALTDGQRTALARSDHQIVMAGEDDPQCERPLQPRQRGLDGANRIITQRLSSSVMRCTTASVSVSDCEHVALRDEFVAQFAEILDDAIVDDRNLGRHVRMRVGLGGSSMCRPAGMADARYDR